uniref:Haloacid dehalogenase-like hydrolase domain-containing protein Sgpp n=1 Tax=Solanum tuberosum TaxID=4113 RepID=M1A523_SOLTU
MSALVSLCSVPSYVQNKQFYSTNNLSKIATVVPQMSLSSSISNQHESKCLLPVEAPLKAILFDIDGTLCDSDPIHYYAFREMLQEIGFNGGAPISEEFFIKNISGMHNDELCHVLFPDWDFKRAIKFMDDKEDMFRRIASEQLKPLNGLEEVCKWIEDHGLKRAAVTNAPRPNAELIISMLGLSDFFELLIIGSECERAKPFPDPYLKALQELGVSPKHAFVFEVWSTHKSLMINVHKRKLLENNNMF